MGEQRRANQRRCFFVGTAFFATIFLGACSTTHAPLGVTPPMSVGEKSLAQYFSLSGRISVRVNDKLDTGQIRWNRGRDEERIGLFSPLGSQVAELVSDKRARRVTLQQNKETMTAASVGELTQSLLGVPLDLDRMAEWTQGFGLAENETADAKLANGDIWQVTAERFQTKGNYRYASRVTAMRGDIVVRLVIDEWTPQ
jgi:outer membrane lipoprotein LolB